MLLDIYTHYLPIIYTIIYPTGAGMGEFSSGQVIEVSKNGNLHSSR